jgi:hypothetical protein
LAQESNDKPPARLGHCSETAETCGGQLAGAGPLGHVTGGIAGNANQDRLERGCDHSAWVRSRPLKCRWVAVRIVLVKLSNTGSPSVKGRAIVAGIGLTEARGLALFDVPWLPESQIDRRE